MDQIPLSPKDFQDHDVVGLSRDLLGKQLFTNVDGVLTGGIIVETEAYRAPDDRASHAFGNRKTARNAIMFEPGGAAYVYLCYGIHHLFNIVTGPRDLPHAILIRAIQPTTGADVILSRRKKSVLNRTVAGGPGALAQGLAIDRSLNGEFIDGPLIYVVKGNMRVIDNDIIASPRVGVDYAGEDAKLPWRFRLKDNPWTSPAK